MKVIICIPARYESSRFPAKVLARETGKYLIQHTYEQACLAQLPDKVLIAGDDDRIAKAVATFDAPYVSTRMDHQSGTDRIAEAVAGEDADIVVNLQSDEPKIDPAHIDLVANLLIQHPDWPMATLGCPLNTVEEVTNPNIVKVIADLNGRAIYFSRSVIPYHRDTAGLGLPSSYLRHIGIYAYRKDFLTQITSLPQTSLEKAEKLEQLRAVEHGFGIGIGRVEHVCDGIDTPEQYALFVKRVSNTRI